VSERLGISNEGVKYIRTPLIHVWEDSVEWECVFSFPEHFDILMFSGYPTLLETEKSAFFTCLDDG
jgi:hypothetical protein